MSRIRSDGPQTGSELARSYILTANFLLYFATPTVLMILDLVRKKEMTAPAISKRLGMTSRIVLDALKVMEREGILVSYVRSKNTLYRIADSRMAKAFEQILEFPERKLKRAGLSTESVQAHESLRTSSSKVARDTHKAKKQGKAAIEQRQRESLAEVAAFAHAKSHD